MALFNGVNTATDDVRYKSQEIATGNNADSYDDWIAVATGNVNGIKCYQRDGNEYSNVQNLTSKSYLGVSMYNGVLAGYYLISNSVYCHIFRLSAGVWQFEANIFTSVVNDTLWALEWGNNLSRGSDIFIIANKNHRGDPTKSKAGIIGYIYNTGGTSWSYVELEVGLNASDFLGARPAFDSVNNNLIYHAPYGGTDKLYSWNGSSMTFIDNVTFDESYVSGNDNSDFYNDLYIFTYSAGVNGIRSYFYSWNGTNFFQQAYLRGERVNGMTSDRSMLITETLDTNVDTVYMYDLSDPSKQTLFYKYDGDFNVTSYANIVTQSVFGAGTANENYVFKNEAANEMYVKFVYDETL